MQYRLDKYGNKISVLGYGCMRFTKTAGAIDMDKAEKELMGKQPKVKPGSNYDPNRPRVRSLHHIDDDEDDLPPRKPETVRDGDDEDDNAKGGNSKIGRADLQ